MALFVEILDGSSQGKRFQLVHGVRLGRTTGEILVPDAKVSGLHAQVEKDEKGQLFLIDKGSANGLRINDQKVGRVLLLPGVKFRVGKTHFSVLELNIKQSVPQAVPKIEGWERVLKIQIPEVVLRNQTSETKVQAFSPPLELTFIQGIQAEQKLLLGYGPRRAGSDVLDIELQESTAPDVAFELLPHSAGVLFRTQHPSLVLLNEEAVSSDILKAGDRIRIGSSLIEVNFLA